ncbi:hypothetical protein [Methanobrevibacter smithii]|nr:hypothetical protein [Methanobrevibacter smithii]
MEFCEEEIEIKIVYALHRRAYYNKKTHSYKKMYAIDYHIFPVNK